MSYKQQYKNAMSKFRSQLGKSMHSKRLFSDVLNGTYFNGENLQRFLHSSIDRPVSIKVFLYLG